MISASEDIETAVVPRLRVLVVDDEPDAADLLSVLLRKVGYEAISAHDGEAALAAARTWLPDVVLLDLRLPGMDGFEMAQRLRADAGTREVHIVALTGASDDEARRRAFAAGCERHLVKGVDLDRLLATITSFAPAAA